MAAVALERMRLAAEKQRNEVLNSEKRRLDRRDLYALLRSADIVVPSDVREVPQNRLDALRGEAQAFQSALKEAGVRTVPQLCDSLDRALEKSHVQYLTLRLDEREFDAIRDELRETVLALTAWSPGEPPGTVFAADGKGAKIADAAEKLCLICVPSERLSEEQRLRTFETVRLLAPRLSPGRLDSV